MKTQLETILPESASPFRFLHNPRLNHLFYWHFHPEYEIVFIEGASATRHVGDHITTYEQSDLVFIGSNIPHLNFDYRVETDYKKEVVHIKPSFRINSIQSIPELAHIEQLFQRAAYGVAFRGETKRKVGKMLQGLSGLANFEVYIQIMCILKELAVSKEYELLHEQPYIHRYKEREQERLRAIYALVDEHYQNKISLKQVAQLSNLSNEAFCRYFKKATGTTFVSFLNQYRISQAKRLLLSGKNVGETCYECGFESLSYFNRTFKKVVGENPSEFRKKMNKKTSYL